MKAHGGGDGPEAVTAALADAFNLPWRPNATKICPLAGGNFNKSWGTCKCWKMMINHIFGGIQFGEKTLFLFNHYVTVPCLCPWNVNDGVTIYIYYIINIYISYIICFISILLFSDSVTSPAVHFRCADCRCATPRLGTLGRWLSQRRSRGTRSLGNRA